MDNMEDPKLKYLKNSKSIKSLLTWSDPKTFLFNIVFQSWFKSGWEQYLSSEKNNKTDIKTGTGLLVRSYNFWLGCYIWIPSRDLTVNIFDEIKYVNDAANKHEKILGWNINPLNVGWKKLEKENNWVETEVDPSDKNEHEWYEPLDIDTNVMKELLWSDKSSEITKEITKSPYSDNTSISVKNILETVGVN